MDAPSRRTGKRMRILMRLRKVVKKVWRKAMERRASSPVLGDSFAYRCGGALGEATLSWLVLFGASGALLTPGALTGALGLGSPGLGKASGGTPGSVSVKFGPCPGRIPFASTIDHRQSSSALGVIPMFSRKMLVLNGLAVALR